MDIFLRRLPDSVTRLDLIKYLNSALNPRWPLLRHRPHGHLVGCEIFQVTDLTSRAVEYHGLAHVEPAAAAKALIARLDGSLLKGKPMAVRKFYKRSQMRDRRRTASNPPPPGTLEQRKEDRRRNNLRIELLSAGATHEVPPDTEQFLSAR